jgi:pyruvate,water dikinase
VAAFHRRLDAQLAELESQELGLWDADRLARLYQGLERELTQKWDVPLANDFFAMVAFGVLGALLGKWKAGMEASKINDLLCGEGGMVSAEPARRLEAMARKIQARPELRRTFALGDAQAWSALREDRELGPDCLAYIRRFGERVANELKLETVTLSQEPAALAGMLRHHVDRELPPESSAGSREAALRGAAEAELFAGLGPLKAFLLRRVLGAARRMIKNRENLRFERTRAFAVVRRLFLGIGARLAEGGALKDKRDVFYLTRDELLGALDGRGAGAGLAALVQARRAEFDSYSSAEAPPERFVTRGPLCLAVLPQAPRFEASSESLKGLACCPGLVKGRVRLVHDPSQAGELKGKILVAARTDPGWTLLFPAASGLLVERGSLLSHSAIVARECALPCIVSIPGLLRELKEGDLVEMDGAQGTVRILERA